MADNEEQLSNRERGRVLRGGGDLISPRPIGKRRQKGSNSCITEIVNRFFTATIISCSQNRARIQGKSDGSSVLVGEFYCRGEPFSLM